MSDIDTQANTIASTLKQKPLLLHALLKTLGNVQVLQSWANVTSTASRRMSMEGTQYASVSPINNTRTWLARVSLVVINRHPTLDEEKRSKVFPAESEAKEWVDQVLREANFLLM